MRKYDIIESLELADADIPEVKISKFERIKNWFNSKRNKNIEYEEEMPDVKISKREKFNIWYSSKKEEGLLKKEQRLLKKEEKIAQKRESIFEKYDAKEQKKQLRKEKNQEKVEGIKTWYNSKKEAKVLKRQDKQLRKEEKNKLNQDGIYTKSDLIKSYIKVGVLSGLSCFCLASAIISAASVLSIGFISTLVCTTGFIFASKIFHCLYKDESEKNDIIAQAYIEKGQEVEEEKDNKVGFFKSLKNRFSKSKELENDVEENEEEYEYVPLDSEELEKESINIKDLIIIGNDVSNVKLTREGKINRVKEECQLGCIRVNNVTSYCVFVAKEDIKLQKFIRSEYRKENPKEKVQSFEIGDKKVLVLANRPNFK